MMTVAYVSMSIPPTPNGLSMNAACWMGPGSNARATLNATTPSAPSHATARQRPVSRPPVGNSNGK